MKLVLQLEIVETCAYALSETHLGRMSGPLSLLNVRRWPFATTRTGMSWCCTYAVLLAVWLMSDPERYISYERVMPLGRTSEPPRQLGFVKLRHHRGHT